MHASLIVVTHNHIEEHIQTPCKYICARHIFSDTHQENVFMVSLYALLLCIAASRLSRSPIDGGRWCYIGRGAHGTHA